MTESNRLQFASTKETTLGTTPGTPRMRIGRLTGEFLTYKPTFVNSDEIRSDRMMADPIKVGEENSGGLNMELHFPYRDSPLATTFESAFANTWTNTNSRDNDGTADSVITGVAATGGVITVTTGTAFIVGELIYNSGFTNSGNNGLFKITTGSATVPAVGNSLLTDEAAPPAAARIKVVGFQGAPGDIAATATGLSSASGGLDFTTMTCLAVGKWVKIGGTGTSYRFATAACNVWGRITAIAAHALTLDNLPATWTTDTGSGKTIRVFVGDQIKNGVTVIGQTFERGFLGQTTPTYIVQTGMVCNTLSIPIAKKDKIKIYANFIGMGGSQSTTALDASPDAAISTESFPVMAGSANVGRIAENGTVLTSPNWADNVTYEINNNARAIEAVDSMTPVDIAFGECAVTVSLNTYFGDNSLYAKLLAGTATNCNTRVTKGNNALIFAVPRLTATEGSPNAQGKNQDVMLPLKLSASYDSTTAAHILADRFEYFEA